MQKLLFYFIALAVSLLLLLPLPSCKRESAKHSELPAVAEAESLLNNTDGEKIRYIDEIIFLGESTTYHLKSRGVLSGGVNTTQVWSPRSGTLMLDASTCDCRIVYPESREELSLSDALNRRKPKYMMLTFGLNGASNFISRGDSYFKHCYQRLIDTVREYSPSTKIILNSCFPIAKNMDMSRYTISSATLNGYINQINRWTRELASANGVSYIDTASLIKDGEGFLDSRYQADDGYHLNTEAYKIILKYLEDNPISG